MKRRCKHCRETILLRRLFCNPGCKLAFNFWRRVRKAGENECWLWQGLKTDRGYGVASRGSRGFRAHRLSWTIHYGEIPEDMLVCHHCDVPACVNPKHLFLGTVKDNAVDCVQKGRHVSVYGDDHFSRTRPELLARGEANGAAKLNETNVREILRLTKLGYGQHKLGRMFGVHQTTIYLIVHRKKWRHVQ